MNSQLLRNLEVRRFSSLEEFLTKLFVSLSDPRIFQVEVVSVDSKFILYEIINLRTIIAVADSLKILIPLVLIWITSN